MHLIYLTPKQSLQRALYRADMIFGAERQGETTIITFVNGLQATVVEDLQKIRELVGGRVIEKA